MNSNRKRQCNSNSTRELATDKNSSESPDNREEDLENYVRKEHRDICDTHSRSSEHSSRHAELNEEETRKTRLWSFRKHIHFSNEIFVSKANNRSVCKPNLSKTGQILYTLPSQREQRNKHVHSTMAINRSICLQMIPEVINTVIVQKV
jgi:hypothetical protein